MKIIHSVQKKSFCPICEDYFVQKVMKEKDSFDGEYFRCIKCNTTIEHLGSADQSGYRNNHLTVSCHLNIPRSNLSLKLKELGCQNLDIHDVQIINHGTVILNNEIAISEFRGSRYSKFYGIYAINRS